MDYIEKVELVESLRKELKIAEENKLIAYKTLEETDPISLCVYEIKRGRYPCYLDRKNQKLLHDLQKSLKDNGLGTIEEVSIGPGPYRYRPVGSTTCSCIAELHSSIRLYRLEVIYQCANCSSQNKNKVGDIYIHIA